MTVHVNSQRLTLPGFSHLACLKFTLKRHIKRHLTLFPGISLLTCPELELTLEGNVKRRLTLLSSSCRSCRLTLHSREVPDTIPSALCSDKLHALSRSLAEAPCNRFPAALFVQLNRFVKVNFTVNWLSRAGFVYFYLYFLRFAWVGCWKSGSFPCAPCSTVLSSAHRTPRVLRGRSANHSALFPHVSVRVNVRSHQRFLPLFLLFLPSALLLLRLPALLRRPPACRGAVFPAPLSPAISKTSV